MAAQVMYTGTFYGQLANTIAVNIWVEGYVGSATNITIDSLTVDYPGDGAGLFDTVLQGSVCEVGININRNTIDGAALVTWLSGLVGNEAEVFIEVVRNSTRDWIGKCLLDITELDDAPVYTHMLTASCGLGQLADYEFEWALNDANPADVVLGNALMLALGPCYTEQFYTATTPFIVSTLNVYEESQTGYAGTKCPLEVTRIRRSALIKDWEKQEPLTCADVVAYILGMGARIRMQNGCWHIIKPDVYTQATVTRYAYGNRDYTNGPLSTTTNNLLLTAGTVSNVQCLAGNNFTYKPALIRVDVLYKPLSSLWLIKEYNTYPYYPSFGVQNLNTYPVQIAGKVTYQVPRLFNGNTNAINGTVRFMCVIKAFTDTTEKYRLTTSAAIGFYWTTDLQRVAYYDFPQVNDSRAVDEQEVKLILPPLTDTSINRIGIEFSVQNITPSCGQGIAWSCALNVQQEFDNGTYTEDNAYTADNQVLTNNSVYKEYELYIGDSANTYVGSAMEVKNSTTLNWQRSQAWYVAHAPTALLSFGQLLAKTILAMQRTSMLVYQGVLAYGQNWSMLNSIDLDGTIYLFTNSARINYGTNEVEGDFIQLQNLSTSIGLSNGIPYRGGLQGVRGDIAGIKDNIRNISIGLSNADGTLRNLLDRVKQLEDATNNTQPLLANVITMPEGYTPGTAVNLKISIDANGKQTITVA